MLTPYRPAPEQPWNLRRVVHLHRRAGFAASWSEIQHDLAVGPQAAVDRLLRVEPSPRGDSHDEASQFEQMSSVICHAAVSSGDIRRLKAWWLYRMLITPDPLGERLTLMWHNHFATSNVKVADVGLMRQQNAIFRQLAGAPFGKMLRRVVKDPAVLLWLDAEANRKEHPNENLAREIMELFSLGVGNYSEDDIKQAARALTGWSVSKGKFRTRDNYHDDGVKTIFGSSGNWNGDDLLRMLADHPATSRRLAFRICDLFMGESNQGAGPVHAESRGATDPKKRQRPSKAAALVEALADGLRQRDLDVGWAVETVLRSEAFFSDDNIGNRVQGPVEFVIGAARALEITDPPPSTLLLAEAAANLGQDLFYPPNVFGWPGGRAWLTGRALIGRANFASALVRGALQAPARPLDPRALAESHGFTEAKDVGAFFAQLLLGWPQLPPELQVLAAEPDRLVAATLASPEAQLA